MQLDGTSFRVKPPPPAADMLRDHPGFQLLEAEEVKQLGAWARPLAPDAPLRRGRLYFLRLQRRPAAEPPHRARPLAFDTPLRRGRLYFLRLQCCPAVGPPHQAWSGNLRIGVRERLKSLMLACRSTSDLSSFQGIASASIPDSPFPDGVGGSTPVWFRMPLPKERVEKLMGESRDAAEAVTKIMELCAAVGDGGCSTKVTPERPPVILHSPRSAAMPEWGSGFMIPKPDGRRSSRSGFCGAPRCRRLLFAIQLCSPPSASGLGCPRILPCHCWFPFLPPRPALVALLDWHAGGIRSWSLFRHQHLYCYLDLEERQLEKLKH